MSEGIPLTAFASSTTANFLNDTAGEHGIQNVFNHSRSSDAERSEHRIPPGWKAEIYAVMEDPTSSTGAFIVHFFCTALIVISALVTVLETVPAFHSISPGIWFGLETTFVLLFTVEYVLRAVSRSNDWKVLLQWVLSFFAIVDLLAILPYYLELLLHQDTSVFFRFSILRMFRLFRVFRPFRHNNTVLLTMEVMYLSVRRSQHALLAIGFFLCMVLTVFSTLLYFAERGTWDNTLETFLDINGDVSSFASIPAAAWFVIVTVTTVGYGDITPTSFLGRLVSVPLLAFGLLMIALPSFVLGREFSLVWEAMTLDAVTSTQDGDGLDQVQGPTMNGNASSTPSRDLSNRKLAQNQLELSKQIEELKETVESQRQIIERLVSLLERREQR